MPATRRKFRVRPHAAERFQQRYGCHITRAEVLALEARCRAGQGILKRRPESSTHALLLGETIIVAVFSNDKIITFLPRDAATTGGLRRHMAVKYGVRI